MILANKVDMAKVDSRGVIIRDSKEAMVTAKGDMIKDKVKEGTVKVAKVKVKEDTVKAKAKEDTVKVKAKEDTVKVKVKVKEVTVKANNKAMEVNRRRTSILTSAKPIGTILTITARRSSRLAAVF